VTAGARGAGRAAPAAAGLAAAALAAGALALGVAPSAAREARGQASRQAESPVFGDERLLLRTSLGDVVIGLYPHIAPLHVEQILKLARLGAYDSTYFHRVERNFVAQITNVQNRVVPLAPEQQAAIRKLPAELSSLEHVPGVASMAREDHDMNSAESSFSLLLARAPHLDGKYTVFGKVEWGMHVLGAIQYVPVDAKNAPLERITVNQAAVKTAAELRAMLDRNELRGPQKLPDVPADPARGGPATPVLVAIGVMMLCGLVTFLTAARLPPRQVSAFGLLTVLVGAFGLVMVFLPRARSSELLATALFFGVVALFKLMNRFESPAPPRPAPGPAAGGAGGGGGGGPGPGLPRGA
jgi:cyclophilin family peptidyl-prolyl cis-trans isomerase